MTDELTPPPAPESALEANGWQQTSDSSETLLRLPAVTVIGRTKQYEDVNTRRALADWTEDRVDRTVRFFAVTTVGFTPSLPPGTTPTMVAPTLRAKARRNFAERLERKGLTGITKASSERFRLPNGKRVRAHRYDAVDPLESVSEHRLPLECWIAVWSMAGVARIVTGGYPAVCLDSQFGLGSEIPALTRSPADYREEFFVLLKDTAAAETS